MLDGVNKHIKDNFSFHDVPILSHTKISRVGRKHQITGQTDKRTLFYYRGKVSLNPYESYAEIVYTTCDSHACNMQRLFIQRAIPIHATNHSVSFKWSARDLCGVRFAFPIDWIKCRMSTNSYKVLSSSVHSHPNRVSDRKVRCKCFKSVLNES